MNPNATRSVPGGFPAGMPTDTTLLATIIAERLSLASHRVAAVLRLLDEGCTIPFIARYRKEQTGALDEVQIAAISDQYLRLQELQKRKQTILSTISEQQKLTPELQQRINDTWSATDLEDLYLPYKPRRRTRAQVAREHGLEPLATLLLIQREANPEAAAQRYVSADVPTAEDALRGAQDIVAETVSEDQRQRNTVRGYFRRCAVIVSKVVKSKADSDEAQKYSDYFDFQEPLRRCSSHRLLAMRRGESEGVLRVSITIGDNDQECISRMQRNLPNGQGSRACRRLLDEAVDDAFRRLVKPSIETEFAAQSKEQADQEAIRVFSANLRQLLLDAPLGQQRVMGIDPGFRTGCKVVCLDEQGNLLHHEAIFPHPPVNHLMQATMHLQHMIEQYRVQAIAIGNGTASRETKQFVNDVVIDLGKTSATKPQVFVVSEDGASVYSASQVARDEFPDHDVTVRGAVSIARRLIDPLAELVKIDPKSIGVGQYQHDVDQSQLKHSLDQTVESCVNLVGVDVNTASSHLLTYVSGLGPALARNIVDYRRDHGPFTARTQLKKVPRLGDVAFQQCAGFLRIASADNPLDNSAVHPERYALVERMAADQHCTVAQLISDPQKRQAIDPRRYVTADVGLPTLNDILAELEKPGRDPRQQIEAFEFDSRVASIDDLSEGMILPGIVTNITNFGAFVDIGVHHDGLVHVSQMADHYVKDPNQVLRLHQHVTVRVVEVDHRRQRISLSMKGVK